MEEHFRKSLGADYSKLFKEKLPEKEKKKEEEEKMEVDPVKAFKDDLDMSGYTGIETASLNMWQIKPSKLLDKIRQTFGQNTPN